MKAIGIAVLIGISGGTSALAQAPETPMPEIIIAANGGLASPWVEKQTCGESGCRVLIYNTETHEIARVDGRLTSYFHLTGVGEEVARVRQDAN